MEKDPICGMEVNEKNCEHVTEYMRKKYYFCNLTCKDKFDKDPLKYIQGSTEKSGCCCGH